MDAVSSLGFKHETNVVKVMFKHKYRQQTLRHLFIIIMITVTLVIIWQYSFTQTTEITTITSSHSLSKTSKSSEKRCNSLINSIENTILDTQLCGHFVLKSDDSYLNSKSQYSSMSYPENVNPSIIVFAACNEDIKLTFNYAIKCNFKVSIRSGGHQYSGLSSCNSAIHQCIQLDVSSFNTIKFIQNKHENIVEIGAGTQNGAITNELAAKGLFVPHGDCDTVAIGGHFSTAGQGHMHNIFGAFKNHVIGFDMILVNGSIITIHKKRKSSWNSLDKIVYKAVNIGYSPGSWGVITTIRIEPLKNIDFPLSIFYKCDWEFNKDVLTSMMYIMKEMYETPVDIIHKQYNFYLRIVKGGNYGKIIRFRGNFINLTNKTSADKIYIPFNKFIDAGNKFSKRKVECKPMYMTPSDYQLKSAGIPYVFPEKFHLSRMHVTPYKLIKYPLITLPITDGFIYSFVNQLSIVYEDDIKYKGINLYAEITYAGLSKRKSNPFLQIATDLYWDENINPNGREIVSKFIDTTWSKLINTWTFGYGWIDARVNGATFGNVNIEHVWQHYFFWNVDKYHQSQKWKSILDPLNIISNSFTVKPFGMTEIKIDFQTYIFNHFQNSMHTQEFVKLFVYCIVAIG
eukprot:101036_1